MAEQMLVAAVSHLHKTLLHLSYEGRCVWNCMDNQMQEIQTIQQCHAAPSSVYVTLLVISKLGMNKLVQQQVGGA